MAAYLCGGDAYGCMAEIQQTEDREAVFTVLHDGVSDLVENVQKLCEGEYGRTCTLYRAFIAKKDPRSYDEAVKEYRESGADMIAGVRDALEHEEGRSFVRMELETREGAITVDIIPGDRVEAIRERLPGVEVGPDETVVYIDSSRDLLGDALRTFLSAL